MARSTRKSLAGQAASVARKVISRRSSEPSEAPTAKKAPAKKTAAKKTAAKKAPVKKAAAPKAGAKKAAAKQAPAAPAPAAKAPAKKAPAKKAPAAKAPAKKAPAAKAPAKKAPAAKTPAKKAPAKKTPAKKSSAAKRTAAAALVVKPGESAWTKTELAEVLTELGEQRAHSAAIVSEQEAELSGLMRDSGDGAGQDQADVGATSFERDHEMTVLSIERDKLAQIEHAMSRIDDGTYGVCETCGEPVGKMRLMAFPRATLCMTCKQREERR